MVDISSVKPAGARTRGRSSAPCNGPAEDRDLLAARYADLSLVHISEVDQRGVTVGQAMSLRVLAREGMETIGRSSTSVTRRSSSGSCRMGVGQEHTPMDPTWKSDHDRSTQNRSSPTDWRPRRAAYPAVARGLRRLTACRQRAVPMFGAPADDSRLRSHEYLARSPSAHYCTSAALLGAKIPGSDARRLVPCLTEAHQPKRITTSHRGSGLAGWPPEPLPLEFRHRAQVARSADRAIGDVVSRPIRVHVRSELLSG
jgi:hypothetical protein